MAVKKTPKNYRFSSEVVALIDRAAQATGHTQTDLIELLVSEYLPSVVTDLNNEKIAGMRAALKEFQKRLKK